jgi:hypothetical protein
MYSFAGALDAERFIEQELRGHLASDRIAFWAMPYQPSGPSEALVLVRGERPNSVHAFGFTEMANAYDFVRHEISSGLHLERVSIYWAAPVTLTVNSGGARVAPPLPPAPRLARREFEGLGTTRRFAGLQHRTAGLETQFVERAPGRVIEFPTAARRLRSSQETAKWWANLIDAMDEALDAYVANQVRGKIAWRRLSRELALAVRARENQILQGVWHEDDLDSYHGDTGDDSWFIPRREWGERNDQPFDGFGSPPGRF